jgi:hypothetical protein
MAYTRVVNRGGRAVQSLPPSAQSGLHRERWDYPDWWKPKMGEKRLHANEVVRNKLAVYLLDSGRPEILWMAQMDPRGRPRGARPPAPLAPLRRRPRTKCGPCRGWSVTRYGPPPRLTEGGPTPQPRPATTTCRGYRSEVNTPYKLIGAADSHQQFCLRLTSARFVKASSRSAQNKGHAEGERCT